MSEWLKSLEAVFAPVAQVWYSGAVLHVHFRGSPETLEFWDTPINGPWGRGVDNKFLGSQPPEPLVLYTR